MVVNPAREDGRRIPPRQPTFTLAGDVISLRTANSAGHGVPDGARSRTVLRDLLDEVISAEGAARFFGVAVDLVSGASATRPPRACAADEAF